MIVVETLIKSEIVEGKKYKYYYRLLKNEVSIPYGDRYNLIQTYGIEAERQDIQGDAVVNIERSSIEKISPYRYKVHNILKLLFDNTVSPIHLVEIAGEFVDDYAEDFGDTVKDKISNN